MTALRNPLRLLQRSAIGAAHSGRRGGQHGTGRDELRRRGVLVRDRSYEIPGCVRVTTGTRDQIQRFLSELEKIW